MQEVYITNANFKKIVTSHEVAKDYKFSDIIVWDHGCGYCITEEESYIFAKWEARDLLMYKVFCIDIKKGATDFYKKIEVHDSWRRTQSEKAPCYHFDKNCLALHSPYKEVFIPDQIRDRALAKVKKEGHEAGQLIINKYREFWVKLETEFEAKANEWRSEHNYVEQFVNRINIRYQLDPPIRTFEVEEHNNSGINEKEIDNRSVQEISDNVLRLIEGLRLWASEEENRCNYFNRYAKYSWLANKNRPIQNLRNGDDELRVKETLKEVHRRKGEITDEIKRMYMRLYIPELRFDASLLDSLGFKSCNKCTPLEELMKNATIAKTAPGIDWNKFSNCKR